MRESLEGEKEERIWEDRDYVKGREIINEESELRAAKEEKRGWEYLKGGNKRVWDMQGI